MQNGSREGAFFFIQLALEANILFPGIGHLNDRFADVSQINLCRPRLSPPTFRKRNSPRSHHDNNDDSGERLHRDQSLVPVVPKLKHALASIESAPSTEKIPLSKGRASATKIAMLRFVARVLIARQHDLCRTGVEAATIRTP
jgi:hypothetical protein